jgi:hypothetical protein
MVVSGPSDLALEVLVFILGTRYWPTSDPLTLRPIQPMQFAASPPPLPLRQLTSLDTEAHSRRAFRAQAPDGAVRDSPRAFLSCALRWAGGRSNPATGNQYLPRLTAGAFLQQRRSWRAPGCWTRPSTKSAVRSRSLRFLMMGSHRDIIGQRESVMLSLSLSRTLVAVAKRLISLSLQQQMPLTGSNAGSQQLT